MPALEPSCGIGPPTFGAISQKTFDFWGLCQPLLQRLTTFAFRVQILAICSKDYFWTFGELRLSQIAPPPSPPAALQPNGQTSFIGFASIFLAKEGGRSLISCWRNWGRRGLEAGAGSWSAWRTKSSKFEILLRLKSLSFLSKVLVWLFV